jgi:hypothetical protein
MEKVKNLLISKGITQLYAEREKGLEETWMVPFRLKPRHCDK